MAIDRQLVYRTTELDAGLLSTPFQVQTHWHVITGAACTGKTTLLDQLAAEGFHTVPESARQYFETELARGRTLDELRRDWRGVQRAIFDMQLRAERGSQAADLTFLDRALPDSLTFHRVFGMDPNELLPDCLHHRYACVFILDRLPLRRERMLGPEDAVTSAFLDEWLARDYRALGYDVVRVPALSPQERLAFVLDRLAEKGSI